MQSWVHLSRMGEFFYPESIWFNQSHLKYNLDSWVELSSGLTLRFNQSWVGGYGIFRKWKGKFDLKGLSLEGMVTTMVKSTLIYVHVIVLLMEISSNESEIMLLTLLYRNSIPSLLLLNPISLDILKFRAKTMPK